MRPADLLLLPVDAGAVFTCECIAGGVPGVRVASPDGQEPAWADDRVGGVIVAGSEANLGQARSLVDTIRASGKPVETLPIGWFENGETAIRYGAVLAGSMLILLKHRTPAAACSSTYVQGSRWLDDEAAAMLVQ